MYDFNNIVRLLIAKSKAIKLSTKLQIPTSAIPN